MDKLVSDKELENVSGGLHNYEASAGYKVEHNGNEYDVVNDNWGCPCRALGHEPTPNGFRLQVTLCIHCADFHFLREIKKDNINGWNGYCTWK